MTFISGFFLVFAGMLTGYFLWYRDRSEEEQKLVGFQQESGKFQEIVANLQAEKGELEERLLRQRGQISILQQLCDDWSVSREQADRERSQLLVEVEEKRRKCEESAAEIQRLRQKQFQLEDAAHQLTRNHLEQLNGLQQQAHLQQLTAESNQKQLDDALQTIQLENQRLLDALHQTEARVAELQSEIVTNQLLLETATQNVSGLQQEYVSLESSLKQSRDELKKVQGEKATAFSRKNQAEEALAATRRQLQDSLASAEAQQQELNQLKTLPKELDQLQAQLRDCQQQLKKVTRQRDTAIETEQSLVAAAAGLQTRLSNQESTIHQLREKHREGMNQLKQELDLRNAIEQRYQEQLQQLEQRIQSQQQQAEQQTYQTQTQLLQQASQLKQKLEQGKAEMEWLKQERESLSLQVQQLQQLTGTSSTPSSTLKSSPKSSPGFKPNSQPPLAPKPHPETPPQEQELLPFSQALEQRKRETFDHQYQGQMERHPLLGMVFAEEPVLRDDLKQISGIGEVLEAKLNDVGIYTYRQIIELTPPAIEELDRILKSRDRILRDRWQEQATQLDSSKNSLDASPAPRKTG
jgi:predicted flap endonuclease-1-like 5' DNA nuclease/chromosome segregation ATPase